MTFLAPALLALGIAAAVPLVLHLLQRQPGPRMTFPALRYLQRAEREHAARIRLRQVLLLALRVLAVLLVAAAAARPFLRVGGAGHVPTSVVLVLDNSLSTSAVVDDRRVLDALKAAALETVERARPDDRLWLIRAGQPWEPAVSGPRERVATAIRETVPAPGAADLGPELERAASILASEGGDRPREIHLLSDLQATALESAAPAPAGTVIRVFTPPAAPPPNRAITSLEVGGGLPPRAGERSTVAVTLGAWRAGAGNDAADSLDLRLVLDGSVRAAGTAPAGVTAVLPFPPAAAGLVAGWVETDADALTADDRRYFAVRVTPPPVVALADTAAFVREALDVLEAAGRIRWGTPGGAEVVVAPAAAGVGAVRRGADVVVLPPASPLELAAANRRLAEADLPIRFGPPAGGEARVAVEGRGLEGVLEGARLRAVYPIEPAGGAPDTVLLRLRTGGGWAVAGAVEGGGRYVALATPLVPDASTIPTSAAMVPLLERAVTLWVAAPAPAAHHRPGDVVALPEGDSVLRPDGTAAPVSGSLFRLESAGVYRVLLDERVAAAFAVNPPASESDPTRVSEERLDAVLAGADARLAGPAGWAEAIFHSRLGRDAGLPLVATLLLLLATEAAVAGLGRRRDRTR